MHKSSTTENYVEYINKHILPFIDYTSLHESYNTDDMIYAKGILNSLHEAMIKIYGSEPLSAFDGLDGFVMIPGVVQGIRNNKICLVLLELDLSSAGEHWGTSFICRYGVIPDGEDGGMELVAMGMEIGSYNYCYTADISRDIHVDMSNLPDKLKSVLKDFRNHTADLSPKNNRLVRVKTAKDCENKEKQSVIKELRDAEKQPSKPKKEKSSRKKAGPEH